MRVDAHGRVWPSRCIPKRCGVDRLEVQTYVPGFVLYPAGVLGPWLRGLSRGGRIDSPVTAVRSDFHGCPPCGRPQGGLALSLRPPVPGRSGWMQSAASAFPDDVPNGLASLSSCALRSAMNAMALCTGLGRRRWLWWRSEPLGLLATAVAKVAGAPSDDWRARHALDIVAAFGSDETRSIERLSPQERRARIQALTEGRGANILDRQQAIPHTRGRARAAPRHIGRHWSSSPPNSPTSPSGG